MPSQELNIAIIGLYLIGMLAFAVWGRMRTRNTSDYFVAGRRLGPLLYTGTLAALVLGGASTVGGVGLGYTFGISGAWLVASIALGVILLSLLFAKTIQRLKIFTVSQMLALRYGSKATNASSFIMLAYTIMLTATSTQAYATVFVVVVDMDRAWAIILGGLIVVAYSAIGGMWSITLADMAQFLLQTVGIFLLMLPFTFSQAGGFAGMSERLGAEFFAWDGAGVATIISWFIAFTFGLLIGQDVWQRVFTARTGAIATWGGVSAGVYCLVYGIAGAVIGMSARAAFSGREFEQKDDVYAAIAGELLPAGVGGFVLAAAVAAMMSTASGALIASATITRQDIIPIVQGKATASEEGLAAAETDEDLGADRLWVIVYGALTIAISIALSDVISALTLAYYILVGGLLVPIVGALSFRRGNATGAVAAMISGSVVTLGLIAYIGAQAGDWTEGVYAPEPLVWGIVISAVVYVVASLITKPTSPEIFEVWDERLARARSAEAELVEADS